MTEIEISFAAIAAYRGRMNNSDQGEWLNQGEYQSKGDSRQKKETLPLVRPPCGRS
jgi:hypothetical protein